MTTPTAERYDGPVLAWDTLPVRIQRMVIEVLRHQIAIMQFECGALILNFNNDTVRPQMDKLRLNDLNNLR